MVHFDAHKGMLLWTYNEKQTGVVGSEEEEDRKDDEPHWTRRQSDPLLLWRPEAKQLFHLYDEQEEFFPRPRVGYFPFLAITSPDRSRNPRGIDRFEAPNRASYPECVSADGKILAACRPRRVRQPDGTHRVFNWFFAKWTNPRS